MGTRIQKILAHLGVGSRRACEELIREGRVTLDGEPVQIGQSLEPHEEDLLEVDGRRLGPPPKKVYWLLNKPGGYVTTVKDPAGRDTVMDLLPPGLGRVYPVGRLDRDTEGALLFTNDGELVHRLLHPSSGVEKEYQARVDQVVKGEHLSRLQKGPVLEDGPTSAPIRVAGRGKTVTLVIKEGRKHQVKRMLKAVGLQCRYLERRRFANLTLEGLRRGSSRALSAGELEDLRRLASS